MLQPKPKICCKCGQLRSIWKNDGGKRYCKSCWSAHNARPIPRASKKKIPPRSPKKVIADTQYSALRKVFLEEYPTCEAHIAGICTQHSTDVHHKGGREGSLYLDVYYWLSACRACHRYIEDHPAEAYAKEWSIRASDIDSLSGMTKRIRGYVQYRMCTDIQKMYKEGMLTPKEVIKLVKLVKSPDRDNHKLAASIMQVKYKEDGTSL